MQTEHIGFLQKKMQMEMRLLMCIVGNIFAIKRNVNIRVMITGKNKKYKEVN
jgi:hypothetical protein